MDFDLSDDQLELRKAAASLLDSLSTPTRVRAAAEGPAHLDAELWKAMAEQGWLSVEEPSVAGGLGLGSVELAVLCEEVGRHVAPVPFTGTALALGALRDALDSGSLDDGATLGGRNAGQWAGALGAGEAVGAIAWSAGERDVVGRREHSGWVLEGGTGPVVYGPAADVVVTCAATDEGQALFAVVLDERSRPGAEPAMDRTRSLGRVVLSARPAWRLGDGRAVERAVDRAAVAVSAEMLGAADHVLGVTVQYAKDRVQFGRPIGSFQAVKHRCADMLVDVEGMRSSCYYAAWAVGAADADASAAASASKVWCSDASRRVMASALQVHGGIGFTWEHDLHLFVKRAQLDQVSFGTARFHRDRLARLLRPRAEAGEPVL